MHVWIETVYDISYICPIFMCQLNKQRRLKSYFLSAHLLIVKNDTGDVGTQLWGMNEELEVLDLSSVPPPPVGCLARTRCQGFLPRYFPCLSFLLLWEEAFPWPQPGIKPCPWDNPGWQGWSRLPAGTSSVPLNLLLDPASLSLRRQFPVYCLMLRVSAQPCIYTAQTRKAKYKGNLETF